MAELRQRRCRGAVTLRCAPSSGAPRRATAGTRCLRAHPSRPPRKRAAPQDDDCWLLRLHIDGSRPQSACLAANNNTHPRKHLCPPSSPSTRAPPPRAPSCSPGRRGRRGSAAGIPQHFPASGWVEHDPEEIWAPDRHLPRGAEKAASRQRTSPPSASPTSARPPWCGTARPARRSTTPSSGRTAAPPTSARS